MANRLIDLSVALTIVSALILYAGLAWQAIVRLVDRLLGRDNREMRRRIRRYGNGRLDA